MHKKILIVVGITILFLGVGFQPALANEVSISKTSDIHEDCLECQHISKVELLKVKLLLIRIEAITNIIFSKFSHIPEVKEKCEEVSNRVITIKDKINELKPDSSNFNKLFLCLSLLVILLSLTPAMVILTELFWVFEDNLVISFILTLILMPIYSLMEYILYLGESKNCWEIPWPPWW